MNVLAERSLSHVQGLELCGQGHPPITRATGESSIQGTWGKEWSCWGKYQSLGSILGLLSCYNHTSQFLMMYVQKTYIFILLVLFL